MVLAHEFGHDIDFLIDELVTESQFRAGNWGLKAGEGSDAEIIRAELGRIYRDLNNPDAPAWTPRDLGYPPEQEEKEYWAEALRAYMTDPNYMKTVAPKAAALIRAKVNDNPRLRHIIQFNSIVGLRRRRTRGRGSLPRRRGCRPGLAPTAGSATRKGR